MNLIATEQALRTHLRSHNFAVLATSGLAVAFASTGWAVLYGASFWLTLVVWTLGENGGAPSPAIFHTVFVGTATVLLLAARVDQWLFPNERAPDERPPVEHLADILFFVPRITLSCWQNFRALAWLRRGDLAEAARLLEALRAAGRVARQALPALFSDERKLRRVLEALLVSGLVEQRREDTFTWIYPGALAPEIFRRRGDTLPAPADPLAGVPPVKIRQRMRLLRPRD